MTRMHTRIEAERQGAVLSDRHAGLREWLTHLPPPQRGQCVATFDTRVGRVRHLPGSAARAAARLARARGFRVVARESFYVADTMGPLLPGEVDRAREWASGLVAEVADQRVS